MSKLGLFLTGVSLFSVLTLSAFGQEADALKEIDAEGVIGKAKFQEFYARFVGSAAQASPSRKQALDAAYGLTKYLNSKGIYSIVVSTERHPDWVRVRILPIRDWERSMSEQTGTNGKNPWIQLAEAGKAPTPHMLCQMADDLFWKCEVSAQFYYYIAFATDDRNEPHVGEYVWNGEYNDERQIVLLPPDFFEGGTEQLDRHPGFIFGLVQHDFHNKRYTRQESPFHAMINDRELARLPAYRAAAVRAKERIVAELNTPGSVGPLSALVKEFQTFLSLGETEAQVAADVTAKVEAAYKNRDIFPKFDSNVDSTCLGRFELEGSKATFYLVSIESSEDPNRAVALETQMSKVRTAVDEISQWFKNEGILLSQIQSPDTLTETKIRLLEESLKK